MVRIVNERINGAGRDKYIKKVKFKTEDMKLLKKLYVLFNKIEYKSCSKCEKQHTLDCPNSFYCYSTEDKPHFKKRLKK